MKKSKYYCFYPTELKSGAIRTITSTSVKGADTTKIIQDNIIYFSKDNEISAFETHKSDDPADSYFHLYTFNN